MSHQALAPSSPELRTLVLDGHADTPQRILDESWDFVSSPLGHGHLNLEAARRGRLDAQIFALWVDPTEYAPNQQAHRTLELLDGVLQQIRRHPNELRLCLTPADILQAKTEGRFAIVLSIEGGHSIENSLALLRVYHQLGVRSMTLTWAHTTSWADSSGDHSESGEPAHPTIPHHNGLSAFGRDVIREMNRLGMMIDVSHVSDKTFWDVLSLSTAPVIASHSSARALTHAPRNLTDEQLRAVRDTGGVVLVNFYPAFIDESWRLAHNLLKSARQAAQDRAAAPFRATGQPVPFHISNAIDREFAARIPRPPLDSLLAHFEHILHVAGEDHIGLGSDFDGISALPQGIDSAADLPTLTHALTERRFSASQMQKLLGGNLLRVFAAVQSCSRL
jgi:membrane dipeptidase